MANSGTRRNTGTRKRNRGKTNGFDPRRFIPVIAILVVLILVIVVFRSCSSGEAEVANIGSQNAATSESENATTTSEITTTDSTAGTSEVVADEETIISTKDRDKLEDVDPFDSVCIVDEIGWFSSTTAVGTDLKYFFNKTGIQPYVYLKAYDESLNTEEKKLAWAQSYFDSDIHKQNAFLYVYFAEEETDTYVGYMCYIIGNAASSVMDDEAIQIFWQELDRNWYTSLSTDAMFTTVFKNTADNIMPQSGRGRIIIIIVGILVVLIVIYVLLRIYVSRQRKQRAKRKRRR